MADKLKGLRSHCHLSLVVSLYQLTASYLLVQHHSLLSPLTLGPLEFKVTLASNHHLKLFKEFPDSVLREAWVIKKCERGLR